MRFKHWLLAVTIIVPVILVAAAGVVSAFTTYNNHVLNWGIGNYGSNPRYYYITSAATAHANDITGAAWDWNHTTERVGVTTPAWWVRTYNHSYSGMDFYYGYYYDGWTGIAAVTQHILNNNVVSPYVTNWNWGKVKLNSPVFNPLSNFNEKGTVAHEMGHVMGLGHTAGGPYRIMCTLADGRLVSGAQPDDCWGINYLY